VKAMNEKRSPQTKKRSTALGYETEFVEYENFNINVAKPRQTQQPTIPCWEEIISPLALQSFLDFDVNDIHCVCKLVVWRTFDIAKF
jgi:hypothetical protein